MGASWSSIKIGLRFVTTFRARHSVPIHSGFRAYLGKREAGHLFETRFSAAFSPRRVQQIVKETAAEARIGKRVYPHLLRHTVAQQRLEGGMPLEQLRTDAGDGAVSREGCPSCMKP